jgi:hypothetical protein
MDEDAPDQMTARAGLAQRGSGWLRSVCGCVLLPDLREQLLAGLHAPFGGRFELREHLLDASMILPQQTHRVHSTVLHFVSAATP